MSLYLWINILSLAIPFLVSFHPRIALYKWWRQLLSAILITMIPFIIWDIYFTVKGYWGFNEDYLTGIDLFHLPAEEWLFFICIPYACVFTHISVLELNPRFRIKVNTMKVLTLLLFAVFGLVLLFNIEKAYTSVDMIFGLVILGIARRFFPGLLRSYYPTFLIMLIPFFIVNGILTGSGLTEPVVWYNDKENLGIRLGSIPVEDSVYAFSLILMNLMLFAQLIKKSSITDQGEQVVPAGL